MAGWQQVEALMTVRVRSIWELSTSHALPNMAKSIASKFSFKTQFNYHFSISFREYSFRLYEELLSAGVLEPLQQSIINCHEYEAGTKHFVAPNGVSSIVKYFINKSGCQAEFEHHISSLTQQENKWYINSAIENTVPSSFQKRTKGNNFLIFFSPPGVFQLKVENRIYLMQLY